MLMRLPIFSSIHMRAPPAPQHIAFSRDEVEFERRVAGERPQDRARRLVFAVVPAEIARLVVDHALEARGAPGCRPSAISRAMSCV